MVSWWLLLSKIQLLTHAHNRTHTFRHRQIPTHNTHTVHTHTHTTTHTPHTHTHTQHWHDGFTHIEILHQTRVAARVSDLECVTFSSHRNSHLHSQQIITIVLPPHYFNILTMQFSPHLKSNAMKTSGEILNKRSTKRPPWNKVLRTCPQATLSHLI